MGMGLQLVEKWSGPVASQGPQFHVGGGISTGTKNGAQPSCMLGMNLQLGQKGSPHPKPVACQGWTCNMQLGQEKRQTHLHVRGGLATETKWVGT